MRVLVCYEQCGLIRDAFKAAGHVAWSCAVGHARGGPHIQADPVELLAEDDEWDLIIATPSVWYTSRWEGSFFARDVPAEYSRAERAREEAAAAAMWAFRGSRLAIMTVSEPQWAALGKPHYSIRDRSLRGGDDLQERKYLWSRGLPRLWQCDPSRPYWNQMAEVWGGAAVASAAQ